MRARLTSAGTPSTDAVASPASTGPVVVALAGAPGSEPLIRAAALLAAEADARLVGLHVAVPGGTASSADVAEHRRLLTELGGDHVTVDADDTAQAIVGFAHRCGASKIVVGAHRRHRTRPLSRPSVLDAIAHASDVEVHLVEGVDPAPRRYRPAPLDRRRIRIAWLGVCVGAPLLTAALIPLRDEHGLPASLLVYLLVVVAAATVGGAGPAVTAALAGFVAGNWFFTPPFHTLEVASGANLLTLVTFLVVAGVISFLVGQVARRSTEAANARSEAEALARAAAGIVGDADPLGALTERLHITFGTHGVALLVGSEGGGWRVESAAGNGAPTSPGEATTTFPVDDGVVLALRGGRLTGDDRRVLQAFAAQLAGALERRRLEAAAAAAEVLAETDRLRTALLRAVSHDLRTPLASIKASVSSLRQDDVDWTPEDAAEFLGTIEEETDRLDRVVGNLLDMGRLQAGALHVARRPIALEEIVPAAVDSIGARTGALDLAISEASPRVMADPALLERALANVISNALRWNGGGQAVRVDADRREDHVHVRVVDHGPGVATADRARMFQPFQRLGDQSADSGVGLGLAVAHGFVEAMGGRIDVGETPGGGLTVTVVLEGAPR